MDEEARVEQRASEELGCSGGKYGGATIRAHQESEAGDAYTACCAKGTERCVAYFCTRSADGERERCARQ